MKSFSSIGCGIFLALFALPFAAVGLFMSGMIFHTLAGWSDMLGWQETAATVLTVDVKPSSDSDSLSTEASYSYSWDDEQHTGDRVSLYTGSDNIGSFQQRIAAELTEYQKTGQPFRCFVDPSDGTSSVLYRDLRWEMLSFYSVFGTLFGTVGMGLLFGTLMSIPAGRRQAALQLEFPDEPWRWKPEWSEGGIRGEGGSRWWTPLAVYWVIVTLPGGLGALNAIAGGSLLSVFGLIMPGAAVLIARAAVRAHLRRNVFGASRVQLDRFPAITGGVMSGTLLIENDADPLAIWNLKLECERASGSGDDRETDTVCELSESVEGTGRSDDWGQSAVPFEFNIPYSAPQTNLDGSVEIEWKLSIRSERTETEFCEEFKIPVFKTEESSRKFKAEKPQRDGSADEAFHDRRLDDLQPDGPLMAARLRVREQTDGTVTVIAPVGRYLKAILAMAMFVVIWDGACVVLWNIDEIPLLFPIGFSFFGVLLSYCWLDLLLRNSHVEIGTEAITFRNGWPGLAREHRVLLADINDVTVTSNMSIGTTAFPNVLIHTSAEKPMTVMSLIRGRAGADRLMERILEAVTRVDS